MKMRSELAWLGPRSAPHRGFRGCGLWVVGCGWRKPWPSVFGAGNLVLVCEVYEVNLLRTLQAVFPSRPNLEPAAEPAGGVAPPWIQGTAGHQTTPTRPGARVFGVGARPRHPASAPREHRECTIHVLLAPRARHSGDGVRATIDIIAPPEESFAAPLGAARFPQTRGRQGSPWAWGFPRSTAMRPTRCVGALDCTSCLDLIQSRS